MSKGQRDDGQPETMRTSPAAAGSHADKRQPLTALSYQFEVDAFTSRYGLTQNIDVFRKAAFLLHDDQDDRMPYLTVEERGALNRENTQKWHQPKLLYFTILICALGAIEQGWCQTAMNGANLYIPDAFRLNPNHGTAENESLGWINAAMYLSNALAGSWLSEPVNNLVGRRGAIFFGTAFCIAGNAGCALLRSYKPTPNYWRRPRWEDLLGFRIILGVGLGINASTVSVFAAESAPTYIRGGLAVCWQMFTAFGIFIGFLANVAFYYVARDLETRLRLVWRWQLAAPLLAAIPLFLLIFSCPESPAWHIKRSRYDRAFRSLCRLRHTELEAAYEVYSTYLARKTNAAPSYLRRSRLSEWWTQLKDYPLNFGDLFVVPRNRHALIASYTVMISQQLCGINIIAFYSSTIFAGPSNSIPSALWASVVFGLINFLGAFPAVYTMDTYGRRKLLLWTLPAMALTMAFMAMSFSIPQGKNNVQFFILAALAYIFCALYSPGMGPVPCAYSAEIYPLEVREVGMSFAIATANFWAAILSVSFPELLIAFGEQTVFTLYALLNVLAWTLCYLFVRETKGVNLEEMDAIFESSPSTFIREKWAEALGGLINEDRRAGAWSKLRQDDMEDPMHVE